MIILRLFIFFPDLSLIILIKSILIKKKACRLGEQGTWSLSHIEPEDVYGVTQDNVLEEVIVHDIEEGSVKIEPKHVTWSKGISNKEKENCLGEPNNK